MSPNNLRTATTAFLLFQVLSLGANAAVESSKTAKEACATPPPSPRLQALMQGYDLAWQNSQYRLSPTDVVIPVQFHIILRDDGTGDIPDSRIFDQIDALSERYRNSRFHFTLKGIDRTENSLWAAQAFPGHPVDQAMKNALAVDVLHVMNVYLCPDLPARGWAYFPWQYSESDKRHGIVINTGTVPGGSMANYNLGMLLVHEVGHYLGVYHTFEGGCSGNGDFVADTPHHTANTGTPPASTDTCPSLPGFDPVHNYMNYVYDVWMTEFSSGQYERMYAQTSAGKPTLWSSGMSSNVSYLSNISTRLRIEPGGNAAFVGFWVGGSGTRSVLIRANGPLMNHSGLSGLPNPTMSVNKSGVLIASNDDWRVPSSNESAVLSTGYAPYYDVESALKLSLSVGGYSAIVSPKSGTGNGIGLVEVYDLNTGTQPNRIINISTRGLVGFGNDVMIGGFWIADGYKEVLIRAIGPSLSNFGVPNPLPNPRITLVKQAGSSTIGMNGSCTAAANYNQIVQAISDTYAFTVSNPNEAMMLKTLGPGGYTVVVAPETGSGGVALVEIYDVNAY